ncbi:MAG TPA: 50S ribosomal protein L25 [Candidatus Paceibacterota bacterium]|nr:50S ribosomal protein L25 [Candidatus Paceibacterota bacterium]
MITLEASLRDVKVNPKHIRKAGNVPAVYYGPSTPSTTIAIEKVAFQKALRDAGESTVITLKAPAGAVDVLIHDVDLDPVTGEPIHVDFYVVAKDRKIQVAVPIEYIGIAPAEKLGGVVAKIMHEVEIESLPGALPAHLTVDLSALTDLGSSIAIADLVLPAGVKALGNPNDVLVNVTTPSEDAETSAPMDLSQITVEKKGKKEEEGESAE